MTSLLPPNRTASEAALEAASARLGAVETPIDQVWRPEACPAPLLPWLAWALSVDEWDAGWSEEAKRASIAAAIGLHRTKGTRASILRALRVAGYGDAELIENHAANRHDGTISYDGSAEHVRGDHWAEYRLILARPVTIRQAAQVRRILDKTAPARCRLRVMDFTEVARVYDGAIRHDAAFAHGAS